MPTEARWYHKLLLLTATLCIALILAETAYRAFSKNIALFVVPSSLPGVGYQMAPNQTVRSEHGSYRVNRWGFRGDDFPMEKPADTFRIVILGDSVTFGQWGDDFDLAHPLERMLQARPPQGFSKKIQVISTAVPAYNTCQEYSLLKEYADQFQPDMVLVDYCMNDPEGVHTPFGTDVATGHVAFWARIYHGIRRHFHLLHWMVTAASPTITRLRGQTDYGPPPKLWNAPLLYIKALHDPNGRFWPSCARCLAGLGQYQADKKVPVAVIPFPLFDSVNSPEQKAIIEQVDDAARSHGMMTIDLLSPLVGRSDAMEMGNNGDDMHPSMKGYLFFADIIHRELARRPELFVGRGNFQPKSVSKKK